MQEKNSQNANLILKRLKKSLKISTDIELSEILNVKPNTISTWKKRDTLDYPAVISICELYEIDLNEVFIDVKRNNNSISNYFSCETPLVSSEIQFQYCINNDGLVESLPKYNFPFIKSSETRVFQVSSNNMYPSIELNSFVVCEAAEISTVKNNSLVVIISKTKGFYINRITREDENQAFILNNENTFFNSIFFQHSDIDEIWLVKGVLSYNIKEDDPNRIKFVHGISIKPDAIKAPSKIK